MIENIQQVIAAALASLSGPTDTEALMADVKDRIERVRRVQSTRAQIFADIWTGELSIIAADFDRHPNSGSAKLQLRQLALHIGTTTIGML